MISSPAKSRPRADSLTGTVGTIAHAGLAVAAPPAAASRRAGAPCDRCAWPVRPGCAAPCPARSRTAPPARSRRAQSSHHASSSSITSIHRRPAIHRQAEGGFGDEHIARHRLERHAGGVGVALVVAGHHHHAAFVFHPHLRRAQHVAGRMQRHRHLAHGESARRRHARRSSTSAPSRSRISPRPASATSIMPAARARMVAMRVRHHRPRHRQHRVDEEIAGGARTGLRVVAGAGDRTSAKATGANVKATIRQIAARLAKPYGSAWPPRLGTMANCRTVPGAIA